MKKRLAAALLALCMLLSVLPATALAASDGTAKTGSKFYNELVSKYAGSDIEHRTEVRWWMAEGGHTDQTIKEEVQAIYDAGFRGIELAQLNETDIDASIYAYGSEQWNHDFRVILETCLDLGMTVGITSGTNWQTTNIPGLDPDTQEAMQSVFGTSQLVKAGASINGPVVNSRIVPGMYGAPDTEVAVRDVNSFIGAYAYKVVNGSTNPIQVMADSCVDLSGHVTVGKDGVVSLKWTAPRDGDY